MKKTKIIILTLLTYQLTWANTYYINNKKPDIIGKIQTIQARKNDTFSTIARRYDVGFDELIDANQNINPFKILPGTLIIIPTSFILPKTIHKGIVINLPEKRLYYFRQNKVLSFPVGIGRVGWATPIGKMHIIQKRANPTWYVPKALIEEQKSFGNHLPANIPPGPDNPLGKYTLRLSKSNYLIHGTNEPDGVGKRISAGCLRMYPEDIKTLYNITPLKTKVTIINQPLKTTIINNKFLIESHPPVKENIDDKNIKDGTDMSTSMTLSEAIAHTFEIMEVTNIESISDTFIQNILEESTGIPTIIGTKIS